MSSVQGNCLRHSILRLSSLTRCRQYFLLLFWYQYRKSITVALQKYPVSYTQCQSISGASLWQALSLVHLLPHCKHKFWVALPITDWVIQLLNNQFQSFSLSLQSHHLLCLKSSRFLVSPRSSESQFLPVSGEVVWGGDSHQLWESQASNTTGSLASLSLLTCLRKWYISVPSWDIKKLLLFKGTLCRQSPGLYPGRRGEWAHGSAQKYTAPLS